MRVRLGLLPVIVVGMLAACSDAATVEESPSDGGTPANDAATGRDASGPVDSGTSTDSAAKPTCANAGCSADATCSEVTGAPVCTCKDGFSGNGKTCSNVNECATTPCKNGATCVDGVNAYTCTCATGYSGPTCETNINDCAAAPCLNGSTCTDGVNSYTCACVGGFSGATCAVRPKSCSAIKTANAAAADGVYMIDPDGAAGEAAFSVYCDMTTDGGGWTKILQYHDVAYTPTAAASGDVTTAAAPAFAKLSDASINALGTALGAGRAYRIQGPTSPLGQKLFIFSTGTFADTSVGMGLMMNNMDVCEAATFAGCVKSTVAAPTYIDSLTWSLVGNDAERYFADYAGGSGVNCYNPSAAGVRCFNAGNSLGHPFIPDVTIWLK